MKKRICLLISSVTFLFSLAAKQFFDERYFEIQTKVPVSVSNNLFAVSDFLKDEITINLREIADKVPKKGMNYSINTAPSVGININTPKVTVGLKAGVDISSNLSLSKDIFDFFGYGNQIGEELIFDTQLNSDIFVYSSIAIGLRKKSFSLKIEPAVFVPVLSMSGNLGTAKFLNDSEGNLCINFASSVDVYSCLASEDIYFSEIVKNIPKTLGVDISGVFQKPLDEFINLEIAFSVPIFPGRINKKMRYDFNYSYDAEVMNFADGVSDNYSDITYEEDCCVYVTRPLNFMTYIDFVPSYLLDVRAGLGLGVRHPFVQNSFTYVQYYLGGSINVGKLLKLTLSTEYTKQVYINQFVFDLNLRLLELETGVSLQSPSFLKSFTPAGVGAYICCSVGF